ncbi:DNA translocase FtsK [Bartonella sp. B17]
MSVVLYNCKVSISYIQCCLRIAYNCVTLLTECMEKEGIIGLANHIDKREIFVPAGGESFKNGSLLIVFSKNIL